MAARSKEKPQTKKYPKDVILHTVAKETHSGGEFGEDLVGKLKEAVRGTKQEIQEELEMFYT